jgi:hypothetical protein
MVPALTDAQKQRKIELQRIRRMQKRAEKAAKEAYENYTQTLQNRIAFLVSTGRDATETIQKLDTHKSNREAIIAYHYEERIMNHSTHEGGTPGPPPPVETPAYRDSGTPLGSGTPLSESERQRRFQDRQQQRHFALTVAGHLVANSGRLRDDLLVLYESEDSRENECQRIMSGK